MSTFAQLTAAQQADISAYVDTQLRPLVGEFMRLLVKADAAGNAQWNATTSANIALLDAGAIVPNGGGLAGAAALPKEDIISMTSWLQGIVSAYHDAAHQQLAAKAAGAGSLT